MAYNKINFVNDETDASAENFNHMEDGIANSYNVSLLAVSETAPSECSTGDKYYNTTTKKIYTATSEDTWGTTGEDPISDILYIVLEERTSYTYDGTDLVSVGGGSGSEIVVGDEEPTEDTKLQIESMDLDAQYVDEINRLSAFVYANYTTTTNAYENLPLTSEYSFGNKITLDNNDNAIVIGSGIEYIRISAQARFSTVIGANSRLQVQIVNQNAAVVACSSIVSNETYQYQTVCIVSKIVKVTPGDRLYFQIRGFGGIGNVIQGNTTTTYITVEEVK